jgi:hypothetical protein
MLVEQGAKRLWVANWKNTSPWGNGVPERESQFQRHAISLLLLEGGSEPRATLAGHPISQLNTRAGPMQWHVSASTTVANTIAAHLGKLTDPKNILPSQIC